ncbi:MAG TPA: hypothetical protein VKE41_16015 [Roseiflexaceae bacterium]|nr:hypothetical protein [Roseiflexaceae bacterium]
MSPIRFHVGDRITARTSRVVPAGTCGTIQHILRSVPDMYYVQFEGLARPHLMYARDLERIGDAMIILCATIEAAAQVLAVLIQARLRLGHDFTIAPLNAGAPIRITVLVQLSADVLRQIRAIPAVTIIT